MDILSLKRIGPYMGITRDKMLFLHVGDEVRMFRVCIYAAYHAGIIGPEHNGLVVFDHDAGEVILDRICEQSTGYFGPSTAQQQLFEQVIEMPWSEFQRWVNSNTSRLRRRI